LSENFADYPQSIAELRSDKTDAASDWTPRDLLIAMLRDIDAGKIDLDGMVLVYRKRCETPGKTHRAGYRIATPDVYTTLGMLSSATLKIARDAQA
jgi:hypothetical protein